MSQTESKLVGEGQLGWLDALGGKSALFPVAAGLLAISALTASDRFASFATALGALVPIWLAWRMRIPHNVLNVLRRGRPAFRVELDDLGVRTFDAAGQPTLSLEWFELGSYHVGANGIVLMMRVAKRGVNAVFAPRSFFSATEWVELEKLVRAKMPGAAKALDDAAERAREAQKQGSRRSLRVALVVLLVGGAILWTLRDRL